MRTKLYYTAAICLMLLSLSCKKGKQPLQDTSTILHRGKIVLLSCGVAAIQLQGVDVQADGSNTGSVWTQAQGMPTYDNAIGVSDYCSLATTNLQVGDTITFNISSTTLTNAPTCGIFTCLIYYKPPANSYNIINVVKVGA